MNQIEQKLRCLAPRSPSHEVKDKIFGLNNESGLSTLIIRNRLSANQFLLATFAIMLICSVMLLKISQKNEFTRNGNFLHIDPLALSNQSLVAYCVPNLNNEHNLLTGQTFRWTNRLSSN